MATIGIFLHIVPCQGHDVTTPESCQTRENGSSPQNVVLARCLIQFPDLFDRQTLPARGHRVDTVKIVVDILPMPNNSAAWVGVRKSLSLHLLLAAFVAVSWFETAIFFWRNRSLYERSEHRFEQKRVTVVWAINFFPHHSQILSTLMLLLMSYVLISLSIVSWRITTYREVPHSPPPCWRLGWNESLSYKIRTKWCIKTPDTDSYQH